MTDPTHLTTEDYKDLVTLHLPPTPTIPHLSLFSKPTTSPLYTSPTFPLALFSPSTVSTLIDLFLQSAAPLPSSNLDELVLGPNDAGADERYTVSGPRGGQFPSEMVTLHQKTEGEGKGRVFFVASTATMLVVVEVGEGVEARGMSSGKQAVWTAVKGFTLALEEKGL